MQNANCLDLVLGHFLVYQLVSSYVSQQIRLLHLRAVREFASSSSSPSTHHPHTDSRTESQTDSPVNSRQAPHLTDSHPTNEEQARSLAARLVRSLAGYLSVWWFGHQLFCSRTADSADRLNSIGPLSNCTLSNPLSTRSSSSVESSDQRSSILIISSSKSSSSEFSFSRSSFLSSDHKPSALSSSYSAPCQLATSFCEPNRFNFLLNFTAAFVHMLDVALKLFILTGASTFMGKITHQFRRTDSLTIEKSSMEIRICLTIFEVQFLNSFCVLFEAAVLRKKSSTQ